MQPLTASPRDALTEQQVFDLLTGDRVAVAAGCEVVSTTGAVLQDITDDLEGGHIERNNFATVHGSCELLLARSLAWGNVRVRPYMTLSNAGVSARFNLGVYVLTSPDLPDSDDSVNTYQVAGYDLLHLLQDGPGDTYWVAAGTTYIAAVQGVLTASGVVAPLQIDGTLQATTLPEDMVWALTSNGSSWLRIINDLLAAIGYRGLWADQDGVLRSAPYSTPATRSVEWTFDLTDESTSIVGESRTLHVDAWGAPNWWRFVRTQMATQPVEGDGIYTVENLTDGFTSQAALGRIVRRTVFLDAADQDGLVAQGDRIVDEDRAVTRTWDIETDPLPIAGHFDVVQLVGSVSEKCQVASWSLPLDGGRGAWVLEAVDA